MPLQEGLQERLQEGGDAAPAAGGGEGGDEEVDPAELAAKMERVAHWLSGQKGAEGEAKGGGAAADGDTIPAGVPLLRVEQSRCVMLMHSLLRSCVPPPLLILPSPPLPVVSCRRHPRVRAPALCCQPA